MSPGSVGHESLDPVEILLQSDTQAEAVLEHRLQMRES